MTKPNEPLISEFIAHKEDNRLMFTRCGRCATWVWPPTMSCPKCGSNELGWCEVEGRGVVGARCEVWRGVGEPFSAEVPYLIAAVDLLEGFTFVTRGDRDLMVGQRVSLHWSEIAGTPWPVARLLEET